MAPSDSSPTSRLARVKFQTAAADIQIWITDAVLGLIQLLQRSYEAERWAESDSAIAARLTAQVTSSRQAWSALEPPQPLIEDWQSLEEAIRLLEDLFEEVLALAHVSDDDLRSKIVGLQKAFALAIERMNQIERRLFDKEQELAQG
ncbi:MAG: hypothetical protein M1274_02230 [Actinobacteria bacterium]|nr:hypothetical protein [Actinomycetota bacterium]